MEKSILGKILGYLDDTTSPFYRGIYSLEDLGEVEPMLDLNSRNVVIFLSEKHYVGLFLAPTEHSSVFIDSVFRSPNQYGEEFGEFLKFYCPNYAVLPFHCQSATSKLSACYCLYFMHNLCVGISLSTCCSLFSPSKFRENDYLLLLWFQQQYSSKALTNLFPKQ